MEQMHVLVLDTSLTATGWALVRLPLGCDADGRSRGAIAVAAGQPWCGVIRVPGPRTPLTARIAALCDELAGIVSRAREAGLVPRLAAAETPPHTYVNPDDPARSSGKGQWALVAQQRTFGAVAQWVARGLGLSFVEVAPAAAKLAAAGNATASKGEVGRALALRFPNLAAGQQGRGGKAWREAVCDALAVAVWADGELTRHRLGVPSDLDAALAGHASGAATGHLGAVLAASLSWRDADAAFGWAAVGLEAGADVSAAQVGALEQLAQESGRALADTLAALAGDWSVASSRALRRVGL